MGVDMQRLIVVIIGFILACGAFLPSAWADQWNQKTRVTFNEPVAIPRQTLAPGTYWFVLNDDGTHRNVVQVFSSDWSKLYATLLTASAQRSKSTNQTEIKFAERPSNKPEALLTWYYPGALIGHTFLYGPRHEKEFAHDRSRTLVVPPLRTRS
jgi:hypothetical protein